MPRPSAFVLLAIVVLCVPVPAAADHAGAGFGQTISGPIVTIPAGTLPAHRWAASVRLEWVGFETFSDPELAAFAADGQDVHSVDDVMAPSFGLAYGFTDRLTIGGRLPHVTRRDIREGHDTGGTPEVHHHGDSRGVGDLAVLAQYRLTPGRRAKQLAVLLGVKLPTGDTGARDEQGDVLELEHQPGSGSVDPMIGAAWSWAFRSVHLDANALGVLTSKGEQGRTLGDLLELNAAATWRPPAVVGRRRHTAHSHVDLVAEVNGEWRARTQIAGVDQPNSGGALVYFSPGFRFMAPNDWSLSGSIGIPFFQDLYGIQHETRLRGILGLGVLF